MCRSHFFFLHARQAHGPHTQWHTHTHPRHEDFQEGEMERLFVAGSEWLSRIDEIGAESEDEEEAEEEPEALSTDGSRQGEAREGDLCRESDLEPTQLTERRGRGPCFQSTCAPAHTCAGRPPTADRRHTQKSLFGPPRPRNPFSGHLVGWSLASPTGVRWLSEESP